MESPVHLFSFGNKTIVSSSIRHVFIQVFSYGAYKHKQSRVGSSFPRFARNTISSRNCHLFSCIFEHGSEIYAPFTSGLFVIVISATFFQADRDL